MPDSEKRTDERDALSHRSLPSQPAQAVRTASARQTHDDRLKLIVGVVCRRNVRSAQLQGDIAQRGESQAPRRGSKVARLRFGCDVPEKEGGSQEAGNVLRMRGVGVGRFSAQMMMDMDENGRRNQR